MKTKKLLVLALALALVAALGCMGATAFAQEAKQLTVNDGTQESPVIPYASAEVVAVSTDQFNVSQFVIPDGTLTDMENGTITQMTFYCANNSKATDATFEVRLLEIHLPRYLYTRTYSTTQATVVYTGKANPDANGQVVIPFTTPYEYKGGHLLVEFRVTGTGTPSSIRFYGTTTYYQQSLRLNSRGGAVLQQFLPKVTFDYIAPTYLDLESSATYDDSKDIEQNYTFTQASEEYTDVTKVKLEWTISDMAATFTNHRTWDPDKLAWTETTENVAAEGVTATFNLENYSSLPLDATVAFTAESGITATATYTDNAETADSSDGVVVLGTRDDGTEEEITGKVVVSVPADTEYFKTLAASTTGAKYGTYTISLANHTNYLTFTALEDESTIALNPYSGYFWYSLDNGETWQGGTTGFTTGNTETITLNKDEKVLFKGNKVTTGYTYDNSTKTRTYYNFFMTGKISASGSVTSLTDGLGGKKNAKLTESCYVTMFAGCAALTVAPELPATTLAEQCYYAMFDGCTSLTTAPVLPATTLAYGCYSYMFGGCESLATAPVLPATTLAAYCYYEMFDSCTSLTIAPELPATTLAYGCYSYMFYACSALETAPVLPATTLTEYCYYEMFVGCNALKITTDSAVEGATAFFTCPATVPTGAVTAMFNNTVSAVTSTPKANTTYYRYTE